MNIVVDSNILFAFFWERGVAKELLLSTRLLLFSPEFALDKIKKHKEEIMHKSNNSDEEFNRVLKELKSIVKFIPLHEYSEFLKEAHSFSPDKDDVDFFALALKLSCDVWSNEAVLKSQKRINVLNTKDVIDVFL